MTAKDFRLLALRFSGAVESEHMGHPDFRCKGKVFATLDYPDAGWGMVKLTPVQQQAYLRKAPAAFRPANGAWGKAGSTVMQLSLVSAALAKEALAAAFNNLAASDKQD